MYPEVLTHTHFLDESKFLRQQAVARARASVTILLPGVEEEDSTLVSIWGCYLPGPNTHRIHGAGIYANIGGILMVNVTIYSIHGSYGICPACGGVLIGVSTSNRQRVCLMI